MLHIPERLEAVLRPSRFYAPVISLRDAIGDVLEANRTPFFPAYTDHGLSHVQGVLQTVDRLIPDRALKLLTDADVAVTVGATLLHDIALHLREPQFAALISGAYDDALPWFGEHQNGREADEAWAVAWDTYKREVRRMPQAELAQLLGPNNNGAPAIVAEDDDRAPSYWTEDDRLIVGEFLRRHHARLAHEIALRGWPGARAALPVLAETLPTLADAVGLVARSHNENMRSMLAYSEWRSPHNERPWGAYIAYAMGVLRIADYLQIQPQRAPAVLLHLTNPRSPISVREWDTHAAVATVTYQSNGRVYVEATGAHSLGTHLHLAALLESLQNELDVTTGVLGDVYRGPAEALRISVRSVTSNLDSPGLKAQLPYLPEAASVTATLDLVRLLVGPLYGDDASVAGRELLQNAVDAHRARRRWAAEYSDAGFDLDTTIDLRIDEHNDQLARLEVRDRGIGMTPDTVRRFFLAAGASLRLTDGEVAEMGDRDARLWLKTGRFGIGALAPFTLGGSVRVTTRHVTERWGITFDVDLLGRNIELRWVPAAEVGTAVEVFFDPSTVSVGGVQNPARDAAERRALYARLASSILMWWRSEWPRVVVRSSEVLAGGELDIDRVPDTAETPPDEWVEFFPPGITRALWRRGSSGARVVHNGFAVGPTARADKHAYQWSHRRALGGLVREPDLALVDAAHNVALTLRRDALQSSTLPFEDELLFSIGHDMGLAARDGREELGALRTSAQTTVWCPSGWVPAIPTLLTDLAVEGLCVHLRPVRSPVRGLVRARSLRHEPVRGGFRSEVEFEPFRNGATFVESVSVGVKDLLAHGKFDFVRTAVAIWGIAWGDWRGLMWDLHERRPVPPLKRDWPVVHKMESGSGPVHLHHVHGGYDEARDDAMLRAVAPLVADVVRGARGFAVAAYVPVEDDGGESRPLADGWRSVVDGFAPRV